MNILEKYKQYHTFYCGPFIGEFGWELFGWQGYLRTLRNLKNVKIIVACQPGHEYLYSDFADTIRLFFPHSGAPDMYRRPGFIKPDNMLAELFHNHWESGNLVLYPPTNQSQLFLKEVFPIYIQFGKYRKVPIAYDVLFHARSTNKLETGYRNWSNDNWRELFKMLTEQGLKIGSIGTRAGAENIPGTYDLRDLPLEELCSIIRYSKVVAGPSSGPMHLASLCKTPHVVWSAKNTVKIHDNRERYEKLWNPLKTSVAVIDNEGWQPAVETVYNSVMEMIRRN